MMTFGATVYTLPLKGEGKYRTIIQSRFFDLVFDMDHINNSVKIAFQAKRQTLPSTTLKEGWVELPKELLEHELVEMFSDLFLIDYIDHVGRGKVVLYGQIIDTDYLIDPENPNVTGARLYNVLADYYIKRVENAQRN